MSFFCPTGVHQHSCLAKEVPDFWSHPPASAGEGGSLHERRPMRPGQILLCQPVVTNHNSFSVQPSIRRGHQSRITHGTTINPVSGDSVAPYAYTRLKLTSGHRLWITSYRLPLVLNKKGYKYMLPVQVLARGSLQRDRSSSEI